MSACPLFCDEMCRAANCLCQSVNANTCSAAKIAFDIGRNAFSHQAGLYVRCFGNFEIFYGDRPLHFKRKKTKELVAFLIDRRGACCTAEEIACALWEETIDPSKMKHLFRNLVADLKEALSAIGYERLIVRNRNSLGLVTCEIQCDYYDYLAGATHTASVFRGEYMEQYSWSETTKATLVWSNAGSVM